MTMKYVAYYRVSTAKQGKSGLGLEAQRETVLRFTNTEPIAEFIEVESGKKRNRKELDAAVKLSKEYNCKLVIAKLDRLARDVEFTFKLMNDKVDFIAADVPECNTLNVGIMATISQHERERISTRIKDAFKARRARGLEHPKNNNITPEIRQKAIEAIAYNARNDDAVINVKGYIQSLRQNGKSYRSIAATLNSEGKRTRTGKMFTAMQVKRINDRFYISEMEHTQEIIKVDKKDSRLISIPIEKYYNDKMLGVETNAYFDYGGNLYKNVTSHIGKPTPYYKLQRTTKGDIEQYRESCIYIEHKD
jgi:DNA invertase Pin-like site-specific DNA recombinase